MRNNGTLGAGDTTQYTGDRLYSGQALHVGQGLQSKNKRVKVVLQNDGNLVLYGDGNPLWWTGVRPGVNLAALQLDGNFVLYINGGTPNAQAVWASDTSGHPSGSSLVAQDDGNLVLYSGGTVLWSSQTDGFRYYGGPKGPNFFEKLVSSPVQTATQAVVTAAGILITVTGINPVPVISDITNIIGEAASGPLKFATAIASGENIGQAVVDNFKNQLKVIKDVAPYAATVVSFVPGIGTTAAAAIAGGIALAEGQSITEAAKAAIRGAIPGGVVAQAAFDTAMKVASGENVGKAALESARNLVPDGAARKAFDVGLAVATGEKIQNAVANGLVGLAPDGLQKIVSVGQQAISSTPGLSDALKAVTPGAATEGFQLAAGLLGNKGINEKALDAIRDRLGPEIKQGFDAALKSQVQHIPWLSNVVNKPTANEAYAQLAAMTPAQRKALGDLVQKANAYKTLATLTPDQQKQLAVYLASQKPKGPPILRVSAASPTKGPPVLRVSPTSARPIANYTYAPYPPEATGAARGALHGALQAPPPHGPHGGHPHGAPHHGSPHLFNTARRHAPWWADGVAPERTCLTGGDPVPMTSGMQQAALAALGSSAMRPTAVRGPDGTLYLFALENGIGSPIIARPCTASAPA